MQVSCETPELYRREDERCCVILGVGNSLMSDDGVGSYLIEQLKLSVPAVLHSSNRIKLLDGGTLGYLLIDRVAEADLLIVLDAANLGTSPGTFRVIRGDDVYDFLSDRQNRSVHEVGLIDLIQMLDLSGAGPKELVLIGVQPENVDWGERLSPSVQKSAPIVAHEVERLLDLWMRDSVGSARSA